MQERHVELDAQQKPKKITLVDKHFQPNTVAQIFWLKNRMREKWRDVREINAQVPTGFPQLSDDISEEELELVTLNLKRLKPDLFDGKQRARKN